LRKTTHSSKPRPSHLPPIMMVRVSPRRAHLVEAHLIESQGRCMLRSFASIARLMASPTRYTTQATAIVSKPRGAIPSNGKESYKKFEGNRNITYMMVMPFRKGRKGLVSLKKHNEHPYDLVATSSESESGYGSTGLHRDKLLKLNHPIGNNFWLTTAPN
jgi:hypothetical protein